MKWLNCSQIVIVLAGFVAAIVIGGGIANADFTFGEPVNLKTVIPAIDPVYEGIGCFSSDGLEIYYIESTRAGGQGRSDLWVLKRDSIDEAWDLPVNLGPLVNSPNSDGTPSISADGLTLLFSSDRPGGYGLDDIYATTRPTRDAPWGQAVNMGLGINSSSYDHCPWMSADDLELYFCSNRSGGFGAADLWVAKRKALDEPWEEPENLGSVVNSPYNEMYLSLSPDGRVLFFSGYPQANHRPGGYGGSDMWMTKRATLSDAWQTPVNLGPMVNGPAGEWGPRISLDGRTLYFVTVRDGTYDNWQASIEPVVDFNGDGQVDGKDLLIMITEFGGTDALCDIGPYAWGNGTVDLQDLIVLADYLDKEVIDPTLIVHWALDETEGDVAKDSVSGEDSFVLGEPVWHPDGGMIGGALELDGIDDCIITSTGPNTTDGQFSVVAWIRGGASGQVIVSQPNGSDWLAIDAEGNLMTELKCTGRSAGNLISDTVITDGQWHRIGLVWDGANRILYVDGIAVAEDTQQGLEGSQMGLYIGTGKAMESGTFFFGLIDDVRIYNRAVIP